MRCVVSQGMCWTASRIERSSRVTALQASRATVRAMRKRGIAIFRPEARPATATGAAAIGALAVGAAAIGGFAIGRLSIKRLAIERAAIGKLAVEEVAVGRLTVRERSPGA
jgi:hypothetical protein